MNQYLTFKEKQKRVFKYKKALVENITPAESHFRQLLQEAGIDFKFQKAFMKDDYFCIVDFYIPKPHKLCIEIDGGYHDTQEQKRKDFARDRYLTQQRRFKVVRIKNEDALLMNLDSVKQLLSR